MSMKNDYKMKDEYDFSQGVRARFYKPHKKSTTIRLNDDIILFFKRKLPKKNRLPNTFELCITWIYKESCS